MSRIGKKPVAVPSNVTATVSGQTVKVKGPKGDTTLREALIRDCRITQTTPKFLKMIAERASASEPSI